MNTETEKKGEKRRIGGKYFGIGLIAVAPVFLFNPELVFIDVLPDAVGYLLILLGLRLLRDLCPHMEEAHLRFRNMFVVALFRIVATFVVFATNQYERPTLILLLTFAFGVMDFIWAIPAWRSLFEGFVYLAGTRGGNAPLLTMKNGKSYTDIVRAFTAFFIGFKAVFTALPEFSVMSEQIYDDKAMDWYRFVNLFRGVAFIAVMIVGTVWLVRILKYFSALKKDGEFIEGAKTKYETEVMSHSGLFVRRGIALGFTFMCIAAALTADIRMDYVNLIPGIVPAFFFGAVFVALKKYYPGWKNGLAVSGVYGAVSVVGWIAENNFHLVEWGLFSDNLHIRFDDVQVQTNTSAYRAFWEFYPVKIMEFLLLGAVIACLYLALRYLIKNYCGYIPDNLSEQYRENRLAEIRRELNVKLIVCTVSGGLTAAAGALGNYMATLSDHIIGEIWWLICIVLSIIFLVSTVYLSSAVNDEVDSRYMLD